jgi:hypothetical protein
MAAKRLADPFAGVSIANDLGDSVGLEQSGKLRCRGVRIERRLNFPRCVENDIVAQTMSDRQCHRIASAA